MLPGTSSSPLLHLPLFQFPSNHSLSTHVKNKVDMNLLHNNKPVLVLLQHLAESNHTYFLSQSRKLFSFAGYMVTSLVKKCSVKGHLAIETIHAKAEDLEVVQQLTRSCQTVQHMLAWKADT